MKKLILALVLIVSTSTFAQERGRKGEKLTPEQQTELQVKKMTLDLDLSEKQQKELKVILFEQAQKREEKMAEHKAKKSSEVKPTATEKYEMKSKILDEQIEMKAKIKKILTQEQFKNWEENHKKRSEKHHERMEKMNKKQKNHSKPQE